MRKPTFRYTVSSVSQTCSLLPCSLSISLSHFHSYHIGFHEGRGLRLNSQTWVPEESTPLKNGFPGGHPNHLHLSLRLEIT